MKKFFFLAILGLVIFSACNKEYTCSCTVSGTVKSTDYKIYNTKKQTTENCNNLSGDTITIEGISGIAECEVLGMP